MIDIISGLNQQELRVLELLAQGLKTSEISKYLALSYHDTAELARVLRDKTGASCLSDLRQIATNYNNPD